MLASTKYPEQEIYRDLKEKLYYDVIQYFDQGKARINIIIGIFIIIFVDKYY